MRGSLSGLAFALAFTPAVLAAQPPRPDAPFSRTVYISVADKDGSPVSDLTAAELEIKEGGKTVIIDRAEVASEPLQVALIVDDNGTGIFRVPLARFVGRMDGQAAMSLTSIVGQPKKLVQLTPDMSVIMKELASLGPRPGTPEGGQLLEGISQAAVELDLLEAQRPVIIALTVGGEEHSTVHSDQVLDQLRKSGAALHVFSVERSALRSTVAPGDGSGSLHPWGPGDLLQENMQLDRVLGEGPKQSGGRHRSIVATVGFLRDLQALASELTWQYRVSYTLPPGAKPSERLNVSVKRKGLVVRAPSKLPT